jgi:hypothetical protein
VAIGFGPAAKLLAIVAHDRDPILVPLGPSAKGFDDLVYIAPGDDVAQELEGGEDADGLAFLLADVVAA